MVYHEKMTVDKFEEWLQKGRPGSRFEYHRGDLSVERESVTVLNGRTMHVFIEPLDTIGKMAWQAYRKGKVLLVQKREDWGDYRYFAVKRSK